MRSVLHADSVSQSSCAENALSQPHRSSFTLHTACRRVSFAATVAKFALADGLHEEGDDFSRIIGRRLAGSFISNEQRMSLSQDTIGEIIPGVVFASNHTLPHQDNSSYQHTRVLSSTATQLPTRKCLQQRVKEANSVDGHYDKRLQEVTKRIQAQKLSVSETLEEEPNNETPVIDTSLRRLSDTVKKATTQVSNGASITVASIIFSIVYLPFTIAILLQSSFQNRPIEPINWQKELTANFWYFSFSLFGFMLVLPFVIDFGLLTSSGLYSLISNRMNDALPFSLTLALFLSLLVGLHLITFHYANMRPDLRQIHSNQHHLQWRAGHFLSLAAVVFEFMQLSSPFLNSRILTVSSETTLDFSYIESLNSVFNISQFTAGISYMVIPAACIAFAVVTFYAISLGYGIATNMQPAHFFAPVLFEVIPGLLYLSIVGRLLSVFNCELISTSNQWVMREDPTIQCWTSFEHKSLLLMSLMGLLFYSGSAGFVSCYRGDAGGSLNKIKYKPTFLILERTLRDLYAILVYLVSDSILVRLMSLPVLITLLYVTASMQPCSIPTLTRLKMLGQISAIYCLLCTLLPQALYMYKNDIQTQVVRMIVFGWLSFISIWLMFEIILYLRRKEPVSIWPVGSKADLPEDHTNAIVVIETGQS